jgi:hypothetical protein
MSEALVRLFATTYLDNVSDHSLDNRGKLFGWDCAVSVRVDGVNRFWLQFRGAVPARDAFMQLVRAKENELSPGATSILLTVEDGDLLRNLATAIDGGTPMPSPGREPWDYVGHRTAAALRRLADALQTQLAELLRHGAPGPKRQQTLF